MTDKIVKNIADGGDYKNKDEISCKNVLSAIILWITDYNVCTDASKKYHEYLVRQLKPVGEEEKKKKAKSSRITQRRQRVSNREAKLLFFLVLLVPDPTIKDK